jgi:hypothetical protein
MIVARRNSFERIGNCRSRRARRAGRSIPLLRTLSSLDLAAGGARRAKRSISLSCLLASLHSCTLFATGNNWPRNWRMRGQHGRVCFRCFSWYRHLWHWSSFLRLEALIYELTQGLGGFPKFTSCFVTISSSVRCDCCRVGLL